MTRIINNTKPLHRNMENHRAFRKFLFKSSWILLFPAFLSFKLQKSFELSTIPLYIKAKDNQSNILQKPPQLSSLNYPKPLFTSLHCQSIFLGVNFPVNILTSLVQLHLISTQWFSQNRISWNDVFVVVDCTLQSRISTLSGHQTPSLHFLSLFPFFVPSV